MTMATCAAWHCWPALRIWPSPTGSLARLPLTLSDDCRRSIGRPLGLRLRFRRLHAYRRKINVSRKSPNRHAIQKDVVALGPVWLDSGMANLNPTAFSAALPPEGKRNMGRCLSIAHLRARGSWSRAEMVLTCIGRIVKTTIVIWIAVAYSDMQPQEGILQEIGDTGSWRPAADRPKDTRGGASKEAARFFFALPPAPRLWPR
jgi:hypothetical protein